jgi:hypothetical protein
MFGGISEPAAVSSIPPFLHSNKVDVVKLNPVARMIGRRRKGFMLILMLSSLLTAFAQESHTDLLALAAALRDVRAQQQSMEASWETYERHQLMDFDMLDQQQHKQDAVLGVLAAKKQAIVDEQAKLDLELQTGQKDRAALGPWLHAATEKMAESEDAFPILFVGSEVMLGHAGDSDVADRIALHFNNLLLLVEHTRVCQVRSEDLDASGTPQLVDVLRVGSLFEYYVSPAGDCAMRGNSSTEWVTIDSDWALRLRTAIRVVRREIPAEVIVVPVARELM